MRSKVAKSGDGGIEGGAVFGVGESHLIGTESLQDIGESQVVPEVGLLHRGEGAFLPKEVMREVGIGGITRLVVAECLDFDEIGVVETHLVGMFLVCKTGIGRATEIHLGQSVGIAAQVFVRAREKAGMIPSDDKGAQSFPPLAVKTPYAGDKERGSGLGLYRKGNLSDLENVPA